MTVDIATDRSAVFTSRDGGDEFGNAGCITSRFNRAVGGTKCATVYGTNVLAAGWHTFRHVATDVNGTFVGNPSIGCNTDGSNTYTAFGVKTLKMRPAADMGDADNANTIRWSHYKQPDTTSWKGTEQFKADDIAWDFCCITNNLQMIQKYGKEAMFSGYTVNRYDGWFYVSEDKAGKEWTFRTQYDDRCALWIDGVGTGFTGEHYTRSPTRSRLRAVGTGLKSAHMTKAAAPAHGILASLPSPIRWRAAPKRSSARRHSNFRCVPTATCRAA